MFDNVVGSGIAGHFADVPLGRIHNVVINEELEYGVAVGAQPRTGPCKAGLIFFSLKDVSNPFTLGCDGQDGYVHDVSCSIVVKGVVTDFHRLNVLSTMAQTPSMRDAISATVIMRILSPC